MASRLLASTGSWLNVPSRTQPWLCAQCAQFTSSAVAFKATGKGHALGRRGGYKGSSRSQLRTTSRTRLVKDLKPKLGITSVSGAKATGKFEVAPKKGHQVSALRQDTAKTKLCSKSAVERASVEALLDAEFDRSTGPSSKKSSNPTTQPQHRQQQLPTSFASPPLLSGLYQSIHDVLGPDARPTPIQSLALKHLVPLPSAEDNRRAYLLASETGSGKSFAYLLPLLQYLKQTEAAAAALAAKASSSSSSSSKLPFNPRALVLAPTHELTRQLSGFAKSLVHHAKLRVLCASRANAPTQPDRRQRQRQSGVAALATARQMRNVLSASFGESEGGGSEFLVGGKGQGSGKERPLDVMVSTPVKALEMVRGWGWDKVKAAEAEAFEKDRKDVKPFKPGKAEMGLERVECVVVDEADVLFDPDFRQTTLDLLSDISAARGHPLPPSSPQSPITYPFHLILASATIPASLSAYLTSQHPSLTRLASPNLHRLPPTLATEHVSTSGSSGQRLADVERRLRRVWAEDALRGPDAKTGRVEKSKVLVFCNKSTTVERFGAYLVEKGVENVALTSASAVRAHGSNRHIQPFLKGYEKEVQGGTAKSAPNVLVTTSLLSRGLDFSAEVKHVFILDAPRNMVDFLHRAGRAARAGEHGRVVVFGKLKGRGSGTDKDVRQKVKALAY